MGHVVQIVVARWVPSAIMEPMALERMLADANGEARRLLRDARGALWRAKLSLDGRRKMLRYDRAVWREYTYEHQVEVEFAIGCLLRADEARKDAAKIRMARRLLAELDAKAA